MLSLIKKTSILTRLMPKAVLLAVLAALSFSAPSLAQNDTRDDTVLYDFFSRVKTFSSDFEQLVTDESGDVLEQSHGQFMLSRPGKFAWIYASPLPQQIISNGDNIWLYDEDLEQVTIRKYQSAIAGSPAELLAGNRSIIDFYDVISNTYGDDSVKYTLIPKKEESQFSEVFITFEKGQLVKLALQDSFSRTTTLNFTIRKENQTLSQNTFEFVVPDGVDVIKDF